MNDAVKDRLKKLAAMAARGVGGEKQNADRLFHQLCEKHGFAPSDFLNSDQKLIRSPISIRSTEEKELLLNVLSMVTDNRQATIWYTRGKLSPVKIETTAAQAAEVRFLFEIYRRAWQKEKERLYVAFIHKHDLFAPTPPAKSSAGKMSAQEAARLRAMMSGMDSVTPRKALPGVA